MALQRKKTNNKLKELDEAKSKFFINIAHELRTPLTLVISPLDQLLRDNKNKLLKLAHANGKKLLALINEIMDLSKLENDQLTLVYQPTRLPELIRRIFFSFQSKADLIQVNLEAQIELEELNPVLLDAEKFERVLNNIISNALKYAPHGSTILLEAKQSSGQLSIAIADEGPGISDEDAALIFNRYYQVNNQPGTGTGIGLDYASEIAQLFGGTLVLDNTYLNGCRFVFEFPLMTDIDKTSPSIIESNQFHQSSSENVKRILIVEDHIEMNAYLADVLSTHYNCDVVFDGKLALEKLQSTTFDLILSDVMMPHVDGFELLKLVRQSVTHRLTPFVLLTARAFENDVLKGFRLGVDDYVTKPFNVTELKARIKNLLILQETRQEFSQTEEDNTDSSMSNEQVLIQTAESLVVQHMTDSSYRIGDLARDLAYSQRQLERIIKKETGFSPVGFVREIKLQKAYQLIKLKKYATVAEVRYAVGIDSSSYFAKLFQERFGVKPSELEVD